MKERFNKYKFIIPSIFAMMLISLLPLMYSIIYIDRNKTVSFEYLTLFLTILFFISLIISLIETALCIIHVSKNKKFNHDKKLIWYFILFVFNILIAPYYYFKYIKKVKDFSKKSIIYIFVILSLATIFVFTSSYSTKLYKTKKEEKKIEEKRKNEITNIITSKDNIFEMSFKLGFKKEDISEYDLYVSDKERNLVTGAFFYDVVNYEEKTADAVLDKQAEFIKSSRKDVKVYSEKKTRTVENKTINKLELSGISDDSSECVYILSTISFEGNTNNVLYIIQVVAKSEYKKYSKELNKIVDSVNLK